LRFAVTDEQLEDAEEEAEAEAKDAERAARPRRRR
jgi:hypothetical protein